MTYTEMETNSKSKIPKSDVHMKIVHEDGTNDGLYEDEVVVPDEKLKPIIDRLHCYFLVF